MRTDVVLMVCMTVMVLMAVVVSNLIATNASSHSINLQTAVTKESISSCLATADIAQQRFLISSQQTVAELTGQLLRQSLQLLLANLQNTFTSLIRAQNTTLLYMQANGLDLNRYPDIHLVMRQILISRTYEPGTGSTLLMGWNNNTFAMMLTNVIRKYNNLQAWRYMLGLPSAGPTTPTTAYFNLFDIATFEIVPNTTCIQQAKSVLYSCPYTTFTHESLAEMQGLPPFTTYFSSLYTDAATGDQSFCANSPVVVQNVLSGGISRCTAMKNLQPLMQSLLISTDSRFLMVSYDCSFALASHGQAARPQVTFTGHECNLWNFTDAITTATAATLFRDRTPPQAMQFPAQILVLGKPYYLQATAAHLATGAEFLCVHIAPAETLEARINNLTLELQANAKRDRAALNARTSSAEDQAKNDIDRSTRLVWGLMALEVGVAWVLACIVAYVLTRPLRSLAVVLESAANMELDGLQLQGSALFTEIRMIQKSCSVMVKNLIAFKTFMPAALFVAESAPEGTQDVPEETGTKDKQRAPEAVPGSAQSSSTGTSLANRRHVMDMQGGRFAWRDIALLGVNIRHFQQAISTSSKESLTQHYSTYYSVVQKIVHDRRGVVDCVLGDRLFCSWNAYNIVVGGRLAACQAAHDIRSALHLDTQTNLAEYSLVVASGRVLAGATGNASSKAFTVLGPVSSTALHLQSAVRDLPNGSIVVATHAVVEAARYEFTFRPLMSLDPPHGKRGDFLHVMDAPQAKRDQNEWMYEIAAQNTAVDSTADYMKAWDSWRGGNVAEAKAAINDWLRRLPNDPAGRHLQALIAGGPN